MVYIMRCKFAMVFITVCHGALHGRSGFGHDPIRLGPMGPINFVEMAISRGMPHGTIHFMVNHGATHVYQSRDMVGHHPWLTMVQPMDTSHGTFREVVHGKNNPPAVNHALPRP